MCICLCVRAKDSEKEICESVGEVWLYAMYYHVYVLSAWWEGVLDIEGE